MNKPFNLSHRIARPQSLGGAFGGLLRLFGRTASDSDLSTRWPEIIGAELAGQATLVGISKGTKGKKKGQAAGRTLKVKAMNPARALTLSYRTEEIRIKVNKYFGYDAVTRVTIGK